MIIRIVVRTFHSQGIELIKLGADLDIADNEAKRRCMLP
jgi:hypothetical protein